MQAKYDSDSKGYMVLMRHIQMKQSQREKFEWVPLKVIKQGNSVYEPHISSDYFRGFVNLNYFKTLDNTYSTGIKLRSKHLHFVSHE